MSDDLRAGREVVSRGKLSLDRAKAREKLRLFRLPDPHFYVLQFVRAASLLGAPSIRFEFDLNNMSCEFDRTLPTYRFDDFWRVAFEERSTPEDAAMHNVALGVGSAQALNPAEIRVVSGPREIVFAGDEETVFERERWGSTRITMTQKFRFGHLLAFFTEQAEARILRRHCAHATMKVIVAGEPINDDSGAFRTTFRTDTEDGSVALALYDRPTRFVFLRDDVEIASFAVRKQVQPAVGVLNSRVLPTDLSGLELAPGSDLDQLVYGQLYDTYHAALMQWIGACERQFGKRYVGPTQVGRALFEYLNELRGTEIDSPPNTRKLTQWFLDQAIFTPAAGDGARSLSASDARRDGRVAYSRARFENVTLPDHPEVLLVDDELRALMGEMNRAGVTTVDVTEDLRDALMWGRTRDIWVARPPLDRPAWPLQREVKLEDARGYLFVPIRDGDDWVSETEVGFHVRINGRLVNRTGTTVPMGIVVDGDFKPNRTHSDIVREPRFHALIGELMAQVAALIEMLAKSLDSDISYGRTAVFHRLVARLIYGQLVLDLLVACGYAFGEALSLVPEGMGPDATADQVSEWPEAIFTARSLTCADGSRKSFRDVNHMAAPPILLVESGTAVAMGLGDALERVLLVDRQAEKIVRWLRPDAVSGEALLRKSVEAAVFMQRQPFRPSPTPAVVREMRKITTGVGGTAEVQAELLGMGSTSEVYFIYRDRLLAYNDRLLSTREWVSERGSFRLVIWSNDFVPTAGYRGLEEDFFVRNLREETRAFTTELLNAWMAKARRGALAPAEFSLMWSIARAEALADSSAEVLPTYTHRNGTWHRHRASLSELRQQASADGGLLRITRQVPDLSLPEGTKLLVLHLSSRSEPLGDLVPNTMIVDIDDTGDAAPARARFLTQSLHAPQPEDVLYTWRETLFGVQVEVGMRARRAAIRGGEKNWIDVLWRDRLLETIAHDVPFGDFSTVVSGAPIGPDPTYKFVAFGRGEVLRAATSGAAAAVREVCHHVTARANVPLGSFAPLRQDLLRFLSICHVAEPAAPFDLYETLRQTPLFETTWGPRIAYSELAELAVEGVIPITHGPSPLRALVVERSAISAHERAVSPAYSLMHVESMAYVIDDEAVGLPSRFHEDPLLNDIAATLVEARGTRLDLFDDSLAYGMRWSDRLADELCSVGADGIALRPDHPLVALCQASPDDAIVRRFVASVVYSTVNRYYQSITDHDELELQPRLLGLD